MLTDYENKDQAKAELATEEARVREQVASLEAALAAVTAALATAEADLGAAMDTASAHEPVAAAAIRGALRPGEVGVYIDSAWRAGHPDASRVLDAQDALQQRVSAAQAEVSRLQGKRTELRRYLAGSHTQLTDLAQLRERAEAAEAQRAADAARPGYRPRLGDLARRLGLG